MLIVATINGRHIECSRIIFDGQNVAHLYRTDEDGKEFEYEAIDIAHVVEVCHIVPHC